jgi:hypothetical protein
VSFHSFVSAGTTAEPLNQSDIPSRIEIESNVNARHLRGAGRAILLSRIDSAADIEKSVEVNRTHSEKAKKRRLR